ncbi:N-acetylmuramoyl-L-alanine amidase [Clostridium aciditolerans]|uniref:N-acetylmuramoyl-L-alanine amidase n=1 Tax=Clostridium aciditolerans TaxID=339861 RepID=A0A934HRS2_9CLOT|nr:N-acetylmuramoyl-L-alanine amidase [Clostridium aciditolerans]MBI6873125.1 N-acetylmuramoyl-L-alanine amidase [Clostridium aciditolerans]
MLLLIFSFFIKANVVHADGVYNDKGTKTNIELDKSWTIRFNQKLDKNTIDSSLIMVTDESGQQIPVDLKLGSDESSIIVSPKGQYTYGKNYDLVIKDGIKGINKSNLAKPAKMKFSTKSSTVNNDQKLTVCIDAGHGGNDSGNVSVSGIKEKDVDLSVALKVGKILQDNGVNVIYTRQSDSITWSKDNDLKPRFDIANNGKADFFVSIHCNSVPNNSSANGVETYYNDSDAIGQKLAQAIQDGLVKDTGLTNRGIKVGLAQHEILRGASGNAVMVQLGFMSNQQEGDLLGTSDFQNKSASAIANGIIKSLSLKNQSNLKISSIADTPVSVAVGSNYTLPLAVTATMSDGSTKKVNVIWDSKDVDTSKEGTFTYKGTVAGYSGSVSLILTVFSKPDTSDNNVVCIDPGHGIGKDTGATGISGLQEDDVTLSVGLKVGKILEDRGVKVVYTRTEDQRSVPMSVTESLQKRCDISNNANAKYFVSIHCNSFEVDSANGTETLRNESNSESERLATAIQKNIISGVGTYNRGLKDGNWLYVVKNTNSPAVLTELGFLTNPNDAEKLASDSYRQKYAEAIANGILECLGK